MLHGENTHGTLSSDCDLAGFRRARPWRARSAANPEARACVNGSPDSPGSPGLAILQFRNFANKLGLSAQNESGPLPGGRRIVPDLRLDRLREMGHELRRPEADLLRDGIYEL